MPYALPTSPARAPERALRLRVLETVGAGSVATQPVRAGTAIRIMTGAPMPDGGDAVVRVEDTREAGDDVEICAAVPAGANVRHAGEDMRAGETVLESGRILRPADIGLIASLGLPMVRVARRVRVAIIATGDELVDVGEPLGPGQIVNSNAYTLAAAVEEAGGEAVCMGIVRDRPELIHAAFSEATTADVVLSTGGVSVGSFDFVRRILSEIGYQERFWKVAQKPGKPLTFGLCASGAGLRPAGQSGVLAGLLLPLRVAGAAHDDGVRPRTSAEHVGDVGRDDAQGGRPDRIRALQSGGLAGGVSRPFDRNAELRRIAIPVAR